MAPHKTRYKTTSSGRKLLNLKGEWTAMREGQMTAIPAAILAVATPPKGPPSDRRYELILRSTRLDDSPSPVAGIDLFTTTHKSEGFQKRHIPLHSFPVPPERRSEF